MILYYCCTQENNDCPNKETCMRYLNAESAPHATLFKYACTEDNNYHLYLKKDKDIIEEHISNESNEEVTDNEENK